ncbi:hypothetical protein ACHAPJ_000425 [Fusarium lateritium]
MYYGQGALSTLGEENTHEKSPDDDESLPIVLTEEERLAFKKALGLFVGTAHSTTTTMD